MSATEPRSCCDGFSRSQAIRRVLDAGRRPSPREWDPRMPIPAGAGLDRRRFLLGAGGGMLAVYGAERLGLTNRLIGEGIAEAATDPPSDGPILVSLFLAGGLDALSLLGPAGDPLYESLRPTLAIAPGSGPTLAGDPALTWAPCASSFAALHHAGKATVIPGIGYGDPNLSHFTSRHFWEVGATSTDLMTGWMGRFLDLTGSRDNPLQGLSLDGQMNPTLATARNPVAAIDTPQSFSLWLNDVWGEVFDWTLDAASSLGDVQRDSGDAAIRQVAEAASETGIVRRALAPFRTADGAAAYTSPVTYPTTASGDLPRRLAGLAAMIDAGLPLKCVALTSDTQFDTHADQASTFVPGVQLVADSVAAFQADLEARGIADRVLLHIWSEFGRRTEENGSDGTDHGAAGTSLLVGSRVAGGVLGAFPGLTHLDPNGNMVENVDFRGLYCSLLEQWFGEDGADVIPGAARFPRYSLLA